MEEARLIPFLPSTILFSLIYENYEKDLKKEIFLCHKNMKMSIEEIYNMPIQDRKFFIRTHNKEIEKEKQSYSSKSKN